MGDNRRRLGRVLVFFVHSHPRFLGVPSNVSLRPMGKIYSSSGVPQRLLPGAEALVAHAIGTVAFAGAVGVLAKREHS